MFRRIKTYDTSWVPVPYHGSYTVTTHANGVCALDDFSFQKSRAKIPKPGFKYFAVGDRTGFRSGDKGYEFPGFSGLNQLSFYDTSRVESGVEY